MLAILAIAAQAAAQQPIQAGEYVTHGAWGELRITESRGRGLEFEIATVGGNGHICSMQGVIKGVKGYPKSGDSPVCVITLKASGASIDIGAPDTAACREYCGARGQLDGTYYLPPEGCTLALQDQRRAEFLRLYRAKDYIPALAGLNGFYAQCKEFLNWVTIDQVRSDLAISQFHLGKHADCLQTLAATHAGPFQNESQMQDKAYLDPNDFDSYIATAKRIWHNQKLCRNPPKPSTKP